MAEKDEKEAQSSDKEKAESQAEFDPCCYEVNRVDLAQKVYALLLQEMRIERERLGRRYQA